MTNLFLKLTSFTFLFIFAQASLAVPPKTTQHAGSRSEESARKTESNDSELENIAKSFKVNFLEQQAAFTQFDNASKAKGFNQGPIEDSPNNVCNSQALYANSRRSTPSTTTQSYIKQPLKNGINQDLPLEVLNHYGELPPNPCSCCSSSMPTPKPGWIFNKNFFEGLFQKACPLHRVIPRDKKQYFKMFHGSAQTSLDSFEESGIKAVGDGNLGEGFYLTSEAIWAYKYGKYKGIPKNIDASLPDREQRTPIMIFEVYVPSDMLVDDYNPDKPNKNALIERHNDPRFPTKFVFRQKTLKDLIIAKAYLLPNG